MRREFEELARQARDAGTIAVIEPMACSGVPDLPTALSVLGNSVGKGGGLMLDAWHIIRGNMRFADIATLQKGSIGCVEIDDGTREAHGSYLSETMNHRLLCGEGEFDLRGLIGAVKQTGYDGPWGVEILSETQRALTVEDAAVRSFETAIRQFDS
jgi:sugar phosphate isomerase/epimerase